MVSVLFRGREITHVILGERLLDRIILETSDMANVESRTAKGNIHNIVLNRCGGEPVFKTVS